MGEMKLPLIENLSIKALSSLEVSYIRNQSFERMEY